MTLIEAASGRLGELHASAGRRAIVCSAFCRSEAFVGVFGHEPNPVPVKRLFVRWRGEDLVRGASDVTTYYEAVARGWEVYRVPDLHAKCYVFDDRMVVGSANLTHAGIGGFDGANRELSAEADVSNAMEKWLRRLSEQATRLNDDLVDAIRRDVGEAQPRDREGDEVLSSGTLALLYKAGGGLTIFTQDFPWCAHPDMVTTVAKDSEKLRDAEHDLALFPAARRASREELRRQLFGGKAWKWLVQNIAEPKHFGELSAQLHNDLEDDPAPFRKDVKKLLSNLLGWVDAVAPDLIEVTRPNYSQRIRVLF